MPEHTSTQVIAGEAEKIAEYVKEKNREGRYNRKTPAPGSRARKEARKEIRGSLSKIIKKAASITELLTEHDQQENLRVLRDAKKATHRIYDGDQKRLIQVPDHKTRLALRWISPTVRAGPSSETLT